MRHSTRRLLRMSMGWILVWTALVAVPSLTLAGSRAGYDIGVHPPAASTSTAWQARHGDGVPEPVSGHTESTGPGSTGSE
jgi:hypothetical protein